MKIKKEIFKQKKILWNGKRKDNKLKELIKINLSNTIVCLFLIKHTNLVKVLVRLNRWNKWYKGYKINNN